MAVAILYSTAPLRLMARFHSNSGIVGDWVSGHSFRNQQIFFVRQAHGDQKTMAWRIHRKKLLENPNHLNEWSLGHFS